jgi:hypothetical protein
VKAVVFALELVAFGHSYKLTGRRFDGAWLPSPPPLARPPPRMLADLIMLTGGRSAFLIATNLYHLLF